MACSDSVHVDLIDNFVFLPSPESEDRSWEATTWLSRLLSLFAWSESVGEIITGQQKSEVHVDVFSSTYESFSWDMIHR